MINRVAQRNKLKSKDNVKININSSKNVKNNVINMRKKKRKSRRRLKPDVILYLGLILFSLLFITAAFTMFFKIDNIYVVGYDEYDTQGIINLSGINKGSNLLIFNKSDAQRSIHRSLPYVESVEIKKKLPSSVEIKIKKAEKSFALKFQDGYAVVSSCGRILEKLENLADNILTIEGADLLSYNEGDYIKYKNLETERDINEIKKSIASLDFGGINFINVSNLNDIILNYENRIDIKLGVCDDIEYKMLTAKEILENKITKVEKGSLDVSGLKYDNKSYFSPNYVSN